MNTKNIIKILIAVCAIFLYLMAFKKSYYLIKYPYDNQLYGFVFLIPVILFLTAIICLIIGIFLLLKNSRLKTKLFSKIVIVLLAVPFLAYFLIYFFLGNLIIEGKSWKPSLTNNQSQQQNNNQIIIQDDCIIENPDPDGYLVKICKYLKAHEDTINVAPANPIKYNIKSIEDGEYWRIENGKEIAIKAIIVKLDCCYMGDIAYIDKETKEVIGFSVGDQ
jgi:uncharacterized protein YacL